MDEDKKFIDWRSNSDIRINIDTKMTIEDLEKFEKSLKEFIEKEGISAKIYDNILGNTIHTNVIGKTK
jgi:hypothetical protein